MFKFTRGTLLTTLLALGTTAAIYSFAETVVIPVGQQGSAHLALPKKGASKEAVRSQFGEPHSSAGPIGTPPITTWNYADFSVYFEYDHVIHAVENHKPQANVPVEVQEETTAQ